MKNNNLKIGSDIIGLFVSICNILFLIISIKVHVLASAFIYLISWIECVCYFQYLYNLDNKLIRDEENPEDYKSIASTRLPPFIALATNSLQIIYLSFWVIFDNTIFIKKIFPFIIIAACSFLLIILCAIFLYLIRKDNNDNEKKK